MAWVTWRPLAASRSASSVWERTSRLVTSSTIRWWRAFLVVGRSAVSDRRSSRAPPSLRAARRGPPSGRGGGSRPRPRPRCAGRRSPRRRPPCRGRRAGSGAAARRAPASANSSAVTAYGAKVAVRASGLALLAHRDPGVGDDRVGSGDGLAGVVGEGDRAAGRRRRPAAHARPRPRRAGSPRARRSGRACRRWRRPAPTSCPCCRRRRRRTRPRCPARVAAVLAHRQQVGQQLAGVEVVGERVDDRHAGVRGHLVDRGTGRRCATRSPRPAGRGPGRRRRPTRASPMPASRPSTSIEWPPSSAMPEENDACVRSVGLS